MAEVREQAHKQESVELAAQEMSLVPTAVQAEAVRQLGITEQLQLLTGCQQAVAVAVVLRRILHRLPEALVGPILSGRLDPPGELLEALELAQLLQQEDLMVEAALAVVMLQTSAVLLVEMLA